jgi:hypothetical protein
LLRLSEPSEYRLAVYCDHAENNGLSQTDLKESSGKN